MTLRPLAPLAFVVAAVLAATPVRAGQDTTAPSPLRLTDAVRLATARRAEIEAARARTRAGEARPTIVSALDEPMIAPSIDHLPFMLNGANVSFTIEQRIPLSPVLRHRRESAVADLAKLRAEASRTTLDVGLEAASAFLMLHERRRTADLLAEQLAFARDLVTATDARYEGATGAQSDVLRAEVEVARLEAQIRGIAGDVRAPEAMLNASLGLDADTPVPPLATTTVHGALPPWSDVKSLLPTRPELAAARADIARAAAEVEVMRDMFRPMTTIRTGPARI